MLRLWTLFFILPALVDSEYRTIVGEPRGGNLPLGLLITGAVVLAALSARRRPVPEVEPSGRVGSGTALVLCGVFAALALSVPRPISWCAWMASVLAIGIRCAPRVLWAPFAYGLAALAASLFHWVAPMWMAKVDPTEWLAGAGAAVLQFFGVDFAATERGVGTALVDGGTFEVTAGWLTFGLRGGLALIVAGVVGSITAPGTRDARRVYGLSILVGLLASFLVQVLIALETRQTEIGMSASVRILAFIMPAWLVHLCFARGGRAAEHVERRPATQLSPAMASLVVLAAAGGAWSVFTTPPSSANPDLQVAVDEGHSTWERLDIPLDRETFGTLATYNYSEWMRGLGELFGEVDRIDEPLTEARLEGTDVLIVKTPTVAYTPDEIATIHRFVDEGGGLYLVGDHNDVFGMNTILNQVTDRYGIHFRDDAVNEIDYVGGQVVQPDSFPPHPLCLAMEPMHYMTSCSLELSGHARPMLWINHGFSDDPDYSKNNFIGDGQLRHGERLAPLVQLAEARPGAGKVLAFTDSTLFSNFSIFFPGVRELAFGGVEWLGHRESARWLRGAVAGWSLLMLIVAGLRGFHSAPASPALVLAGVALGLSAVHHEADGRMDGWDSEWRRDAAVFDMSLSAGRVPVWHESHDHEKDNFWGAYLGLQRSGLSMTVALNDDDVFSGQVAFLAWPKLPLPAGKVEEAQRFVERGGKLYVLDDRGGRASAGNALMEPFGLTFDQPDAGRSFSYQPSRDLPPYTAGLSRSMRVQGGEPMVLDERGDTIVARAAHGRGYAVAIGLAEALSNANMATASEVRGLEGFARLGLLYEAIDAADPTVREAPLFP